MEFTEKDIEKYIAKKEKLEKNLADELAFGKASKATLRKIEELNCIINYQRVLNLSKELFKKVEYYEEILRRHGISYLKD